MKVLYKVDRTKAIEQGNEVWGMQVGEVDLSRLSDTERKYLARCSLEEYQGQKYPLLPPDNGFARHGVRMIGESPAPCYGAPSEEAPYELLRLHSEAWEARNARKKAEYEAEVRKLIQRPFEKAVIPRCWETNFRDEETGAILKFKPFEYSCPGQGNICQDPRVVEHKKALQPQIDQANAKRRSHCVEQYKAKLQREQDRKREKEEAEQRKADQIRAWVEQFGDASQKARFAENLLSLEEVTDALRAQAFEPLDGFPRYRRLRANEIPCRCDEYFIDECTVEFDTDDGEQATAAEYAQLVAIRSAIQATQPTAEVAFVDHEGTRERCEQRYLRKSVRVSLRVGEFSFTREYAAIPEDGSGEISENKHDEDKA